MTLRSATFPSTHGAREACCPDRVHHQDDVSHHVGYNVPAGDRTESATYLLYDGACGTGGMLTVAEDVLQQLAGERGKQVSTHLFGQEINAETYAICKADLLLKGEGEAADNIVGGPEHSTLSNDAYPAHEFDFMLSNPPYGKSWNQLDERVAVLRPVRRHHRVDAAVAVLLQDAAHLLQDGAMVVEKRPEAPATGTIPPLDHVEVLPDEGLHVWGRKLLIL